MKKTAILSLLILPFALFGQDSSFVRKKYTTQPVNAVIHLDGIPNEEAWNAVDFGGDFTQWQPNDGQKASQPTQFKILYDDKYLYVAYWAHDVSADSVIKRMGRRDDFPGDFCEINIDSYHDFRTAFSFTISASGVRGDEFVSDNGSNWDESWNPIWYAKTHVHSKGWTAEIKIPFSQLRYGNEKEKIWGIQIMRRLFRKEERSIWQYIPQRMGVWVSAFGELHGIKNIPMHRQVEIAPYVTALASSYKKEPGNPFAKGFDKKLTTGLDGKVAITNNLILDYTVNPDFGQVEADPSQVRIDGFQNFFSERRPFFIESRNIFDYQLTDSEAGGDYDSDLLFYSRRIGSSPHGNANVGPGEFVESPPNTTILGAAKFSGKTKKGLSIGILESITQRETATIDSAGVRSKQLVEPLTSYFVGRLQQDYNGANTVIGGIFTAVNREKGLGNFLHSGAYTGGLDFLHQWKNRWWYMRGNIIFSHVTGSKQAILHTQTSFEHLFQRPGAKELYVDSNRTSLTGTSATFRLGKQAGPGGRKGQVFKFETGFTMRSPQLELNDIGFMLTSNEINHFTWASLNFQKPISVFRSIRFNYNHWSRWDYSGKFLFQLFNTNAHATFKNNWNIGAGFNWNPYEISNNAMRGAATIRRPNGMGYWVYVNSDFRKKVQFNVQYTRFWGFNETILSNEYNADVTIQPVNAFQFTLSASYANYYRQQDQFVRNISFAGQHRTIVGKIDQNTLRFTGRLTYNITPDLTLQYYGQPFITRPLFSNFAYVSNGMAKKYNDRFKKFTPNQISLQNNTYLVDENIDGSTDYSFHNPDFNFVQFNSNLIVRWEYKPGSELYLVWNQGNTPYTFNSINDALAKSLFNNAFNSDASNIFLLKWTYRFLR
ncbi:MAG TPA: DUF5916 domain-containing protein [Ferruginibacter sp.]|nr:DUF5916 domain-containing protein [Ferruginibacter sp.]HRE63835.1 DUF5916 domain-containing protein [Ferruginibacter sp.]